MEHSECVSMFLPYLLGTQCAFAVFYCHLWPVSLDNIFPHFLINGTIFERGVEGNVIERKIYVLILRTILFEIFLILRKIHQDIITNVHMSATQSARYSCQILNEAWSFSGQILE